MYNRQPPYSSQDNSPVIQQQPTSDQPFPVVADDGWTVMAAGVSHWSNDIHNLTSANKLLIKQQVEFLEVFVGFETKNKYTIKTESGEEVFYAIENNDCCTRNCFGRIRPFEMKILDKYQNEIIHLSRPLRCQTCCFPCCLQTVEVFSPPGHLVGRVDQECSIFMPFFTIRNAANEEVFKIKSQSCIYLRCCCADFKILSKDMSTEVGRISKQWSGLLREAFTDADYFGVSFPMDIDVRMKAVLMGASFLIDFMFYEQK